MPSPADAPPPVVAHERGERRASVFLWMIKICFFVSASFYLPYWDDLIKIGPTDIFIRGYVIGYVSLFLWFAVEAALYWRRIDR